MNLGYTRNLRQNTSEGHKHYNGEQPEKRASAGLAPIIVMIMLILCIFTNYTYRRAVLEYDYEQIESGLIYALLSGAVINLNEYAVSGNMIIGDSITPEHTDELFRKSYAEFLECLRCSLGLDESMTAVNFPGMIGQVVVEEYKVFQYIENEEGYHVTANGIIGGNGYTVTYPDNTDVYVQANDGVTVISETSVYARISFTLHLMGSSSLWGGAVRENNQSCTLTRLVGITDNGK